MKNFIRDLYNAFETRTRTSGKSFVCLKDEKRDQFKDIVRDMHGTDFLPDDFRFETIESILGSILDSVDFDSIEDTQDLDRALDDARHEIVDGLVSIYNKELTQWIDSHLSRADYVDQASREYGPAGDFFKSLQLGQFQEIDEIFGNIQRELISHLETEEVA